MEVPAITIGLFSLWIHTMNRCKWTTSPLAPVIARKAAWPAALCLGLGLAVTQAQAQNPPAAPEQPPALNQGQMPIAGTRQFPASAKRGTLEVKMPPEVTLNGVDERLSPGHRIRGPNNQMVMSGQLVGRSVQVNYVRNVQGQIHEVWILNSLESREEREGGGVLRNFNFGSANETVRRDDGKTPFDQLPKYKN